MAASDDLEIIKMAEGISDAVWERVGEFDDFAKDTVGRQLVRAADSIGANLAESCGRFHYGDKLLFLYYARGSLFETKYWVNRSFRRKLIEDAEANAAINILTDLARRLNVFVRSLKQVKQSSNSKETTVREASERYVVNEVVGDVDDEFVDFDLIDTNMLDWLSDLSNDNRFERRKPNY